MSVVSHSYEYSFRGANSDIYVYFKELNERLVIIIANIYKKYLKTHNSLFRHIYTFYTNPRI